MRNELPDIIYSVIQDMDVSMTITDYSFIGTTHTIEVCDVRWAQVGYTVTIGGNDYVIQSVNDQTNIIVLTGANQIFTFTFDLYRPNFTYGTPVEANNDLKAKRLSSDKYPMFYLLLSYEEINRIDPEDPIERISNFRLFALADANHKGKLTTDIHSLYMKPMSRMFQSFINTMYADKSSFYMDEFRYTSIDRYKFGVYITNTGAAKNFFVDDLSGWELRMTDLAIRKQHSCTQFCPVFVEPDQFDDSFDDSFA